MCYLFPLLCACNAKSLCPYHHQDQQNSRVVLLKMQFLHLWMQGINFHLHGLLLLTMFRLLDLAHMNTPPYLQHFQ